MITQKRLKEVLKYDQHTGEFISLVNRGSRVKAGESLARLNAEAEYGYHQNHGNDCIIN